MAQASSAQAVYGATRFSIPALSTKPVKVKLTKAGRKVVRRYKSVRMMFVAAMGSEVVTGAVKVKRTRK